MQRFSFQCSNVAMTNPVQMEVLHTAKIIHQWVLITNMTSQYIEYIHMYIYIYVYIHVYTYSPLHPKLLREKHIKETWWPLLLSFQTWPIYGNLEHPNVMLGCSYPPYIYIYIYIYLSPRFTCDLRLASLLLRSLVPNFCDPTPKVN